MEFSHYDIFSTLEELSGADPDTRLIHGTGETGRRNVLILGGAGFLGTTLSRLLIESGHRVTVLDRFFYGGNSLESMSASARLRIRRGDVRNASLVGEMMAGKDTVVNLAAIVGDEACRIDPQATWEINVEAAAQAAALAEEGGVKRFIHTSTCSTYGKNGGGLLDEDTRLVPLSLYAESKVESERSLMDAHAAGKDTAICILRLSTLFGFSRRPRFDLVVNTLTGHAWKKGKITIFGGSQWRPILHVGDAARAILKAVESEPGKIAGRVYNTGGEELNLTITDIGARIKEIMPRIEVAVESGSTDERDYRIDFSRIRNELGFTPRYSISNGVHELIHALETSEGMDPENPIYSNYRWLSGNRDLLDYAVEMVR